MILQTETRRILLLLVGAILANVGAVVILESPPPAHAVSTFIVNSSSDDIGGAPLDNGVCETAPGNGVCTLRAAIMKANHYSGGGVTIILPAGSYTLTIPKAGQDDEASGNLNITNTMSILGSGASSTRIDGNHTVTHDNVLFAGGGLSGSVLISGTTIQDGSTSDSGGGIENFGILMLINSAVSGNSALNGGGGIRNGGYLSLANSVVSGNSSGQPGGGIWNDVTLTSTSSTVSGNGGGLGGGIWNRYGALTVINSTISGNYNTFSNGDGGGIYNYGGSLTMMNSTISGNNANGSGGGIYSYGTTYERLFNVTISDNQADYDSDGVGSGGGVSENGGTFTFQNSIIALNRATLPLGIFWIQTPGDCHGSLYSVGYNIMYSTSNCTVGGSGVSYSDPLLGPLANNGGATKTHALLGGSPAIDMGDNSAGECKDNLGATITTDQRGFHRPAGPRCDIGAYEDLSYKFALPLIFR